MEWVKPDGSKITTNDFDATIDAAQELGWKPADEPGDVDARGVAWDAELHTANHSKNSNGTWKLKRGVTSEMEAEAIANGHSSAGNEGGA